MGPEPVTAWMVREGDPSAEEGTLSMAGNALSFEPASGTKPSEIPIDRIQNVRRARGSPVMSISFLGEERVEKVFVYFAKPPPLPGERPTVPMPLFRSPKGLEKSAAALSLRASNRLLKREIDGWVEALRGGG